MVAMIDRELVRAAAALEVPERATT